jgi:ribonuclease HII
VVGARAIDRDNIRRATLGAMAKAVALLRVRPDVVLVDGVDTVPGVACPQHAVIDGDARMLSIAAASVVAKVVRDRIMCRLDRVWPNYGFAQHKGYGTPEHLMALEVHGPCPLHRLSFRPCGQTTLFPRYASAEELASAADAAVLADAAPADRETEAALAAASGAAGEAR